jgi:radical SAM protein with 4Fe4S-binding SPASM domain
MQDRVARESELSFEEHCRILDEITEAGCVWLLYTGGEIFARRDFLDIYTYAKRKGLIITLFTNGTMITPAIADHLAEWRPFAIEITLYGRSKETYERVTGIPGSYERCRRGIDLILERKLPLKLKTVGLTLNKHELRDMRRFAEEELALEFKFDSMINPRIDCSQSPLAVRLTPEEIVGLDLEDSRVAAEWHKLVQRTSQTPISPDAHDKMYQCGGGITSFAIDPQGQMSICVLSQMDKYDLRTGSFRDGWQQFLLKVRKKTITRPTKCVSCSIKSICGMCPANGELENGDPEAPVDFLCKTAHLRSLVFGAPITPHGDCEYCIGGVRHDDLMQAAAALRDNTVTRDLPEFDLNESVASFKSTCENGQCASCGLSSARVGRESPHATA